MLSSKAETVEVCPHCGGLEWVTINTTIDDPNFGKAFPCPECKADKLNQAKLDRLIASSGLRKHHMFTFEDFQALPAEYREGKEYAAQLAYDLATTGEITIKDLTKYGLMMKGPFGTGKTTLGCSALIEGTRRGLAVLYVKFADLLDDIQDLYNKDKQIETGTTAESVIQAAQRAPLALFDDIGDPKKFDEMQPDKRRLSLKLFEYRLENDLPTIITTNCAKAQLDKQFGERTTERLFEMCHVIEVTGKKLRQ